jgi:hypothetical protein
MCSGLDVLRVARDDEIIADDMHRSFESGAVFRRPNDRVGIQPPIGHFDERHATDGHHLFRDRPTAKPLVKCARRILGQHPEEQGPHAFLP